MSVALVGSISILLFAAAFAWSGTVDVVRRAVEQAKLSASVVMNPDLDDEEKERLVQRAALGMFSVLGSICLRLGAVLLASMLPIAVGSWLGYSTFASVTGWLVEPKILLLTVLVFVGIHMLQRRSA
jgi:hypothetical protein